MLAWFCWLAGCGQSPTAAPAFTLPVDAKNGSDGAAAGADAIGGCSVQVCDDGNPCTADGCDAVGACVHGPQPGCGSTPIPCAQASDCANGVCDATLHSCVDCQTTADCSDSSFCVNSKCVAETPCASDGACKASHKVCSTSAGFCVDCNGAADCPTGQVCVANHCATKPTKCASSKDCPGSQVCSGGACVACAAATDCGAGQNCQAGTCVAKVCAAPVCVGASVWKCNADGTGYAAVPESCDDGQDCTTDGCVPGIGCAHAVTTAPACGNGTCDCGETPTACGADCGDPAMIWLPGGTFKMGSPAGTGWPDEQPQHEVVLAPFQLDRTEVTVAQYTMFYNELSLGEKCNAPNDSAFTCGQPDSFPTEHCNWGESGKEQHPINCVDWFQASAYCKWAHKGGRLPTESEWEFAARSGGQNFTYPWGNAVPTCSPGSNSLAACIGLLEPVCSHPTGNSAQGLCDLAGNVPEWCSDWYSEYQEKAQVNPTGPGAGSWRVNRGELFSNPVANLRAAFRGVQSGAGHIPSERGGGFRCARTL